MKKFFLLALFFPATPVFAQDSLLQKPLDPATDYACFRESSQTRLEIYYSLSSTELALTPTDSTTGGVGKNLAYVLAYLDLSTADGRPVDSLSKTTAFRVARTDTTNELSEILDFLVPPGNYRAYLSLWDIKSGKSGRDSLDITVPDLASPDLSFSSVQLARLITDKKHSPEASYHKKSGRLIVPHPPSTYSLDAPRHEL